MPRSTHLLLITLSLTEFIVILCELTVADCAVFVDNTSDLNDAAHARLISAELDHLYFAIYKKETILSGKKEGISRIYQMGAYLHESS